MCTHWRVRLVVDTSVFVSALLGPRGASREVLRGCLTGTFEPLMGTALFCEYEALLARRRLFVSCKLTDVERQQVLDAFLSVCRWTKIYFSWRPNLPDEGDNHLVDLAVAGGAQAIVTKNVRDLRRSELLFPGISVLKPGELLKESREWPQ
jgi:putative PIN family toxin of toxin-antitoxin system